MEQLRYIWLIALKDLKIFATDRAALFFFIVFPFMFVIMFYFLNIGAPSDDRLSYHLVTREAEGGLSYQIIGAIETRDESALQPGDPIIVWDKDYDADYQKVENGELSGFIAFPVDFTERIYSGQPTQIDVITDSSAVYDAAALEGLAGAIAASIGTDEVIVNASLGLMVQNGIISGDPQSIGRATQQILAQIQSGQAAGALDGSLIALRTDKIGEIDPGNPADYVIPGYLVMFVFFAAAVTAETIVRERQNNTLERMLVSSVKPYAILGGMYTGTALRGLIQVIIFWLVGIFIFKMDLGLSPLAIFVLSFLMVIMSSAFAIMLATLVKTRRSAGSLATISALILAPLGGCWWPLFIMPRWMQTLAKISPHAWANEGFNKLLLFNADFGAVVPEMLALVVFTVIFGAIAVWRFRTSAV